MGWNETTQRWETTRRVGWTYGLSRHPERDTAIVKAYRSGVPSKEIAAHHKLSRARIHQIVDKETRNGR
jgi:hypothetical protein